MSRESNNKLWAPLLVGRGSSVAHLMCSCLVALTILTGCSAETGSVLKTKAKAEPTSTNVPSELKSKDFESVVESPTSEKPLSSSDSRDLSEATMRFAWHKDCGIDFVREDDMRGLKRIFESTGGGVGVVDFDRDGELDLIFTGGCKVPEELTSVDPTSRSIATWGRYSFRIAL